MTDADAALAALEALIQLYGECPEDDFEPDCATCRVSVIIRELRALRECQREVMT